MTGETTGTDKGSYTVTVTGKGNYAGSAKAQSAEPQAKPQQAESGLRAAAL